MYKKYRRGANVADGIDSALSVTSVGLAASGVGLLLILARIKRTERIFSFSNKSQRDIVYDFVVCPEHVVLYLKALDITRMHALH